MNFISGIISLTVGIVMISGVVITTVKGSNTTGWSAAEISLFGLITLVSIAGIVYGAAQVFGLG
jgi:hypothetical protein